MDLIFNIHQLIKAIGPGYALLTILQRIYRSQVYALRFFEYNQFLDSLQLFQGFDEAPSCISTLSATPYAFSVAFLVRNKAARIFTFSKVNSALKWFAYAEWYPKMYICGGLYCPVSLVLGCWPLFLSPSERNWLIGLLLDNLCHCAIFIYFI
uniref:Protein RFT1 homolog n=1 Tax=Heterorhabditis bacteriophora TaxID=37862 RepID=A0A1I7XRW5_HETBA